MGLGLPDNNIFFYLDALADVLAGTDPGTLTNAQFEQRLKAAIQAQRNNLDFQPPLVLTAGPQGLFLGNHALNEVNLALQEVEAAPLRETAAFLEAVIERREEQADLWPDGRLELGITYAALGESRRASEKLEEVIQICQSGGRFQKANVAMAV